MAEGTSRASAFVNAMKTMSRSRARPSVLNARLISLSSVARSCFENSSSQKDMSDSNRRVATRIWCSASGSRIATKTASFTAK